MIYSDNPIRDWDRHCDEEDRAYKRWLAKCPICVECKKPIEDGMCYEIDDTYICESCMDRNHRVFNPAD